MKAKQVTPNEPNLDYKILEQYLQSLRWLDSQIDEEKVISGLNYLSRENLMKILANLELEQTKSLVVLFNKYACKLISAQQYQKALTFLEQAHSILNSPVLIQDADTRYMQQAVWNNLAILSNNMSKEELAKNFLNKITNLISDKESEPSFAIVYNNIATICYSKEIYHKAINYSKKSLLLVEDKVYEVVKDPNSSEVPSKIFLDRVKILLVAYLNIASSIERIKNNQISVGPTKFDPTINEKVFWASGYKISKKFLGRNSSMTVTFQKRLIRSGLEMETLEKSPSKLKVQQRISQNSINSRLSRLTNPENHHNNEPKSLAKNQQKRKEFKLRNHSSYSRLRGRDSSLPHNRRQDISEEKHEEKSGVKISKERGPAKKTNEMEVLMQSSLEKIIKHQKDLEERINHTLDETLHNSMLIQRSIEDLKRKELETKIQMLKEENQNSLKKKIVMEWQLDKLRLNYYLPPMGTLRTPYFQPEKEKLSKGLSNYGKEQITENLVTVQQDSSHSGELNRRSSEELSSLGMLDLKQQEEDHVTQQQHQNLRQRVPSINIQLPKRIQNAAIRDSLEVYNRTGENYTNLQAFRSPKFLEVDEGFQTQLLLIDKNPSMNKAPSTSKLETNNINDNSTERRDSISNETLARSLKVVADDYSSTLEEPKPSRNINLLSDDHSVNLQSTIKMPSVIVKTAENFDELIHQTEDISTKSMVPSFTTLKPPENPSWMQIVQGTLEFEKQFSFNRSQVGNTHVNEAQFAENGQNLLPGRAISSKMPNFSKSDIYKRYGTKEAAYLQKLNEQLLQPEQQASPNISIKEKFMPSEEKADDDQQSKNSKEDLSILKKGEADGTIVRLNRGTSIFSRVDSEYFEWENKIDSIPFADFSKEYELLEPLKPSDLLKNPDYIKFPQKSTISKRINSPGTCKKKIECRLGKGNAEPVFLVSLKECHTDNDDYQQISQEIVRLKEFKRILNHIEYKDSLPSTVTLKSIKTYSTFVRYLLIPFIGISQNDEGRTILEIWEKPASFLQQQFDHSFFGESAIFSFYHLQGADFRIVLTHPTMEKFTVQFDVSFDTSSFNMYFEEIIPKDSECVKITRVIDIFSDEDAQSEELKEAMDLISRCDEEDEGESEISTTRLKKEDLEEPLFEMLQHSLNDFESYLKEKGFQKFEQFASEENLKYLKLKITNECKRKCGLFLKDNPQSASVEVCLKNFFETHAPERNKVKVEGRYEYKHDQFWKDYGVIYTEADSEDKKALYAIMCESYNLEVHEKPCLTIRSVLDLEPEDYEAYDQNPIIRLTLDCGGFKRYFFGEQYKIPLTISLVGARGNPQGVKATLYDATNNSERGVFLTLQPQDWKKIIDPTKKERQRRFTIENPIKKEYEIAEILKRVGFDLIHGLTAYKDTRIQIGVLGTRPIRNHLQFDILENYVTIPKVVKYLQKFRNILDI